MTITEPRPSSGSAIPTPPLPPPKKASPKRRARILWIAGAVALAALIGALVWWRSASTPAQLLTQPVTRGQLVQSVTATGTVSAVNTVSVGSQVSGTISQLFVDYNSKVKVGQVLARIEPSTFQATVDRDKAQLAQAQSQAASSRAAALAAGSNASASNAGVSQAQANYASAQANVISAQAQIAKAQAALDVAQLTVNRDKQLIGNGYIAQSTVDSDASNLAAAKAGLAAAKITAQQAQLAATASQAQLSAQGATAQGSGETTQAQVAAADANEAAVRAAQAQLTSDQINLDRTVITSPVNGTVISRAVSVGQTVASSFQTPTLFSIAEDLTKMELDLAVGEPDMGSIKTGEAIDFTVLAYPNDTFHATVAQVRKNPTTVNNVVTYDIVAYVNNGDGRLFPGMTANASIHVAKAANALIVPLAALQWRPSSGGRRTHASPAPGASPADGSSGAASASAWGQTGSAASSAVVSGSDGRVFTLRGSTPARVAVHIDLVSGGSAAVTPEDAAALKEGDQVVVGDQTVAASSAAGGNLFQTRPQGGSVPRQAR
jgi:HlyD family secretion protein